MHLNVYCKTIQLHACICMLVQPLQYENNYMQLAKILRRWVGGVSYEYNKDNRNEFVNTIKINHNCNFCFVSVLFRQIYPTSSINCLRQVHHGLGASTMLLLLKHTQPQQPLVTAILQPQQLAAYSYFIPLLAQQLLEALIYITAIVTISSCYFTIKAAISSLQYLTTKQLLAAFNFTATAMISSIHSNYQQRILYHQSSYQQPLLNFSHSNIATSLPQHHSSSCNLTGTTTSIQFITTTFQELLLYHQIRGPLRAFQIQDSIDLAKSSSRFKIQGKI